jgi:hypothetical protein
MSTNRVVNIVLTELSVENLKLQEDLEISINSRDLETNDKVNKIKVLLEKLALNEMMISKFQTLLSNLNNNEQKED